jgi:hypothetical protein
MLFEHLLMRPTTLSSICRLPALNTSSTTIHEEMPLSVAAQLEPSAQDNTSSACNSNTLPLPAALQLSRQYRQQHYSPLAVQERVLVALGDQLLNMSPADADASAAAAFMAVWDKHSSLRGVPITLKRVSQ